MALRSTECSPSCPLAGQLAREDAADHEEGEVLAEPQECGQARRRRVYMSAGDWILAARVYFNASAANPYGEA
jgi:hypothetical protein